MENEINLPFRVGELAEAKSFQIGFRGAWFRCKIKEISKRKGHLGYASQYYDFPDEKVKWTKLYQVPFHCVGILGKAKERHRELMLRPAYPPIYNEKQIPSVNPEVAVIVNDSWKVGDLVDWWTTGCYWSARITQLLGDDKAQVELKRPPLGEGSFYEVLLKDIRPSLDWSPEYGWTMPTQEGDSGSQCARLIKPINQATPPSMNSADIREPAVVGRLQMDDTNNVVQETEAIQRKAGSSVRLSPVSSNSAFSDEVKSTGTTDMRKRPLGAKIPKELKDTREKNMSQESAENRKTSWVDTDSGHTSAEPAAEEDLNSDCSLKKYRASGALTLNSMRSDTLEAAVMDLEEYVNKVKWLKSILHRGISSSDAPTSQWEFVDPQAASEIPK